MKWTLDKIKDKFNYFKQERVEKRSKFTEFVVRMYYCIYKQCTINNSICCRASEVSSYKVKHKIYEGFYDGKPDHDNKSVIDDCVRHLKEMGYIQFKRENEVWVIYLKRPLDFLLEGEHEAYLEKYEISNEIEFE